MNTLKDKIEEIIRRDTLAIICPKCGGGGQFEGETCTECSGDGLTEWRFGESTNDILKVVKSELLKKLPKRQIDRIPLSEVKKLIESI